MPEEGPGGGAVRRGAASFVTAVLFAKLVEEDGRERFDRAVELIVGTWFDYPSEGSECEAFIYFFSELGGTPDNFANGRIRRAFPGVPKHVGACKAGHPIVQDNGRGKLFTLAGI